MYSILVIYTIWNYVKTAQEQQEIQWRLWTPTRKIRVLPHFGFQIDEFSCVCFTTFQDLSCTFGKSASMAGLGLAWLLSSYGLLWLGFGSSWFDLALAWLWLGFGWILLDVGRFRLDLALDLA